MKFLPTQIILSTDTLFFFIFAVSFFSLGAFLIIIFSFISKWLKFLQQEKVSGVEILKQSAYKKAQQILDDTRSRSVNIISDANKKAVNILSAIEGISSKTRGDLKRSLSNIEKNQKDILNKTSEELLKVYEEQIEDQKNQSLQTIAKASEDVDESLTEEVEELEDLLRKKTIESLSEIEGKISAKYEEIDKELGEYRDKKFDQMQESLNEVIYDVTKKVLGEGLDMDKHQDLIISSLEQAKKKNLFVDDEDNSSSLNR